MTNQTLRKQHIQVHFNQKIVQVKNEIVFKHYMDIHPLSTVASLLFIFLFFILSLDVSINEKEREKEVNIIFKKPHMHELFSGNTCIYTSQEKIYRNHNYTLIKLHS